MIMIENKKCYSASGYSRQQIYKPLINQDDDKKKEEENKKNQK